MTTDLWMLLAAAGVHFALILVTATPNILNNGPAWAMGNREESPPVPEWVARSRRASANLLENMPLFTILVLVAHVAGQADETSAMGAMVFVVSRIAHAACYVAGVPYVRTAIWLASLVGLAMIASAIAT